MRRRAASERGNDAQRYSRTDHNPPGDAAHLDAVWMTEAMRAAGVIGPADSVTSTEVEAFDSGGRAMTGELSRVAVGYDPPEAGPARLIAKFASSDRMMKGMIEQADSYAREIYFYRDLSEVVPVRVPRHLGSGISRGRSRDQPAAARVVDALPAKVQLALASDVTKLMRATKRHYALLIEDCSARTKVYNLASPPSPERLAETLDALAGLHGRFWGGGREAAGHASTGPVLTRTPRLYANELRHRGLEVAAAAWSQWWTDEDSAVALDAADRLCADVRTMVTPITLIHGDTRSDNVLFPVDGGEPILIDWGAPAVGHPAWDVSYLLGSSLEESSSDAARDLVAGYRKTLAAHGAPLDESELWAGVVAGLRMQVVFMVLAVRVMPEGSAYGDAGFLHELWAPRVLSLLRRA